MTEIVTTAEATPGTVNNKKDTGGLVGGGGGGGEAGVIRLYVATTLALFSAVVYTKN